MSGLSTLSIVEADLMLVCPNCGAPMTEADRAMNLLFLMSCRCIDQVPLEEWEEEMQLVGHDDSICRCGEPVDKHGEVEDPAPCKQFHPRPITVMGGDADWKGLDPILAVEV